MKKFEDPDIATPEVISPPREANGLVRIGGRSQEAREPTSKSRRNFLKVAGSASAVGAVAGCAPDIEQNVYPYVKAEDGSIPGEPAWYASTCTECSAACGTMVKAVNGRVIKVEGNKDHPVNRGSLCALGQASLQHHYDPDRVREPLKRQLDRRGRVQFVPISWDEALQEVGSALAKSSGGFRALTGSLITSEDEVLGSFAEAFGGEIVKADRTEAGNVAKASEIVFGLYGVPEYHLAKADMVLNFGADFLETWVSPCELARKWAASRRGDHPTKYIHLEPRLSLTGANADQWIGCKPGSEVVIARALLGVVMAERSLPQDLQANAEALVGGISLNEAAAVAGVAVEKLEKLASGLAKAQRPLILGGGVASVTHEALSLPVLANLLNLALGAVGKTLSLRRDLRRRSSAAAVVRLVEDLEGKKVKFLLLRDGNPAFTIPQSTGLVNAVRKAGTVVAVQSHLDETAYLADIILPTHSGLEKWGYDESSSGTLSLLQPAMGHIFDTKDFVEVLFALSEKSGAAMSGIPTLKSAQALVRERVKKLPKATGKEGLAFEEFWTKTLAAGGVLERSSSSGSSLAVRDTVELGKLVGAVPEFETKGLDGEALVFFPYFSVKAFDGRAANRPWLQELPDPITQLVWDAWVELHPDTAGSLGVKQGDLVSVRNYYGEVNAPAYLTPNIAPGVAAMPLGQGHQQYGRYAREVGAGNPYSLLSPTVSAEADSFSLVGTMVSLKRAPGKHTLVGLSGSESQEDRGLARTSYIKEEDGHGGPDDHEHGGGHGEGGHHHGEPKQMYEQREHPMYKWGLTVDLNACTGCSACVVACYAENNIPVVGKDLCNKGREMSWLRIERYYDNEPGEELQVSFLPMMCQHCNNAPCEPVCPVYATYHNEEGLNAMVYNRCVGTRYCSNNCSYKVRRFNWVEFQFPQPLDWQLNPYVTKRTAGVMEKCTFCVQRITAAKDTAKDEGRLVRDGDIEPACVQGCPTNALAFGNLNDPNSKVSKLQHKSRAYKVLDHHINTQPAVSYLERVKYEV